MAELDWFPGLLVSNQDLFPLHQGLRVRPSALCTSDFLENSQLEGDCLVQYPQFPGQSRAPAFQPQTGEAAGIKDEFHSPQLPREPEGGSRTADPM